MDADFNRPVCKMKKLWATVAERVTAKLRELGDDVTVKAHECDSKWRNMMSTYRKNAERAKRRGAQIVHWEFFQAMHDVLGKAADDSDEQRNGQLSKKLATVMASKKFTPILPTPPLPPTPSPSPAPSRPPQDVLQLYLELQERKMDLWTQQKDLEERKIEAINNLARAISSLAAERSSHSVTGDSG
ncbi:uncharacterized protein LOC114909196 isoform X2 [Scleropages formosus]|nr:uncharacterized protein LOC114909196 isoform X2 [Scleropages formosus]